METERENMAETDMNSLNMNRKERGKFSSLNKQEAKIILETYVKRSLSNRETKRMVERKEKRPTKVRRSVSDLSKFRFRAKENKMSELAKPELQESKKEEPDGTKRPSEPQESDQPETTDKVKTTKKQSWFKNFLNNLFKKEENVSEQTVTVVSCVTPAADGHSTQSTRKNSFKKTHIRKVLSFKKNVEEDDTKLKRPNYLPLKRTNKLSSLKKWEKNEDCYYQQVSTEIELLVNETDCTRSRHQSLEGDSVDGESQDTDDVIIKKIVSILQKEGDAYDSKIKEDPKLNCFFSNISYSSFKKLADVYVEKEIKKASSDATNEDIRFAFSIHFTKQVVGISSHPVNRIMGFGNQYLEDTFTWLSHSRNNLNTVVDSERCLSPD